MAERRTRSRIRSATSERRAKILFMPRDCMKSNAPSNSNSNDNENANSNSSNSSASSMSEDDKHKLYHAAGITGDAELIRRVSVKIGLMNDDYTPGEDYQKFVDDHLDWAMRNTDFINSVNTPEKARAYVNKHFSD